MQKFSACRNRASPIHRFSSTRMRCITAICPAGPPKLSRAIRSHTANASAKETPWTRGCGAAEPDIDTASVISPLVHQLRLWLVGRPVVGLGGGVAAPAKERIIKLQSGLELFEVVAVHARQPERCRQKARGLRRQIQPRRVGGADDGCQPLERRD